MSVGRLRKITAAIAEGITPHIQQVYCESIVAALHQAFASTGPCEPVMAIGRDGVTLCMREQLAYGWARILTVSMVNERSGCKQFVLKSNCCCWQVVSLTKIRLEKMGLLFKTVDVKKCQRNWHHVRNEWNSLYINN